MPKELLIQDEIRFVLSSGRQKRFLIKFMYDATVNIFQCNVKVMQKKKNCGKTSFSEGVAVREAT